MADAAAPDVASAPLPGAGKLVCVTGAPGLVSSHIIKQLLARGYTVRGTVFTRGGESHYAWLKAMEEGTKGTLELVFTDFTSGEGFEKAVAGCEYVVHSAQIPTFDIIQPAKEIVIPAIQGTKHLLDAVLQTKSAKKVIVTSSVEAVKGDKEDGARRVFDEQDWHADGVAKSIDLLETGLKELDIRALGVKDYYALAKTRAEKYAWEVYEKQKGNAEWSFELVTICPGLVLGTMLDKGHKDSSLKMIVQMMSGALSFVPDVFWSVVHAHDVALAHVAALEKPEAKGRFIVTADFNYSMIEIAHAIKEAHPSCQVPHTTLPNLLLAPMSLVNPALSADYLWRKTGNYFGFSNKKAAEELGIKFIPGKQAILASAQSLIDAGVVPGEVRHAFPYKTDWSVLLADKVEDKEEDGTEKDKIDLSKVHTPIVDAIRAAAHPHAPGGYKGDIPRVIAEKSEQI